jgi:hypothetical protein
VALGKLEPTSIEKQSYDWLLDVSRGGDGATTSKRKTGAGELTELSLS